MKKLISLLPIALLSVGAIACAKPQEKKDYYEVTFKYNTKENDGTYLKVIVMPGQVLDAPKDPTQEDYIFEGWYKDSKCQAKYLRWGLEIDDDLTLYANWNDFESLDLRTKIEKFQESLKVLGKDASTVTQTVDASIVYPFNGDDVFSVKDKYIYRRYQELTEKEYYQIDDVGNANLYGKEQFSYDTNNFYRVYVDLEDSRQNENESAPFVASKLESFISIDFQNLFKSCENNILAYSENEKYQDPELFEYNFTGNYTRLNSKLESYTYTEGYSAATLSEQLGDYVTQQYAYSFGLTFINGKIKSANVQFQYLFALGQEVYQYEQSSHVYDFYYNNGIYPTFTGTLLPR